MGHGSKYDVASYAEEDRNSVVVQDVEGLRALRQIAGKGQADVAAALRIKQPSVSKIEKQADMHVSTLRAYVEAVGGQLELTVKLPKRPAVRLQALGDGAIKIEKPETAVTSPLARVAGRR